MLTIKQILDDKEAVIRGLKKKRFANAEEAKKVADMLSLVTGMPITKDG